MNTGLIYQQIPKIMADIDAIGKDRRNSTQNFNFRGIDDVYNELHSKLAKHGVFTVPEVLEQTRQEKPSKSGGMLVYSILKIKFTFFASDGSSVAATMIGEGMDSGDKASNKAQAIAHKYAFLQVFSIPTEDEKDPDSESHEIESEKRTAPLPLKTVTVARPMQQAEINLGDYVIEIGKKHFGKKLKDMNEREIQSYADWLEQDAAKSGKPLSAKALDFVEAARAFLKDSGMGNIPF